MVLELILAYGIVVGAIVGLSNVLPEYEREKVVSTSEGKMKGAVDGESIGSMLRKGLDGQTTTACRERAPSASRNKELGCAVSPP